MELLSGNEAIAQGAWEAGCTIGLGYPGTPSTETLESFATKDGVYAEWCPNEKVALEVAAGVSAAGERALVTMKHVGVNVAADPLFTLAYTGVGGGLVLLAADDPGMHSSQNEQDSRFYAPAARIPIFDPADSQEAHDFARDAFALSEEFDIPFMLRSTVRISHAKTPVELAEKLLYKRKAYEKDVRKWVMMPAFAKPRRDSLDERCATLRAWVETCPYNTVEMNDSSVGIICSGAVYQYVKDALPHACIFKLGITWPLPQERLVSFRNSVKKMYCIDEASNYLSTQIAALGIVLDEMPGALPAAGELSPLAIKRAFSLETETLRNAEEGLPARPPALCAGCPHRLVFKELTRAKCIITGDIGCYTLGALPPLSAMDTTIDMGASISMAHGFELALAAEEHRPVVAIIGDSTFAHSGITSLLNTAYNQGAGTVCILDNRTTGMTGHQGNPVNGKTLQGRTTKELNLERLIGALGIEDVQTVNPNDMQATRNAIKAATKAQDTLSVIVFRSPCVLLRDSFTPDAPYYVDGSCTACGACISLGCPAIAKDPQTGCASIDAGQCVGCGQCGQYCAFDCIKQTGKV